MDINSTIYTFCILNYIFAIALIHRFTIFLLLPGSIFFLKSLLELLKSRKVFFCLIFFVLYNRNQYRCKNENNEDSFFHFRLNLDYIIQILAYRHLYHIICYFSNITNMDFFPLIVWQLYALSMHVTILIFDSIKHLSK